MSEENLLGRTGLEVSRLALGGLFTSSYGGELQQSIETIHRAIELGVNYIDTAPGYFDSEEVIGKALATVNAPVIVSTKLDVLLTAANYSILWREAETELLPAAKKHGVSIVAGTPLQQGALAARYDKEINEGCTWMAPPRRKQFQEFYHFLDGIEMSLIELAHRFVLSHPDIDCVLSGARSVEEIEGNINAVQGGPLPDDILRSLDEIAAMVPFRPYDEPTVLPFRGDYSGPAELR